jgi:hypothetical protein
VSPLYKDLTENLPLFSKDPKITSESDFKRKELELFKILFQIVLNSSNSHLRKVIAVPFIARATVTPLFSHNSNRTG